MISAISTILRAIFQKLTTRMLNHIQETCTRFFEILCASWQRYSFVRPYFEMEFLEFSASQQEKKEIKKRKFSSKLKKKSSIFSTVQKSEAFKAYMGKHATFWFHVAN
jgi:hypothetical protein